jgi:hypothetical protein
MPIYSRTNLALSVNDPSVGRSLRYDHFIVSENGDEVLYITTDWSDAVKTYWEYREAAEEGYYSHIGLHGIVVC